MKFKTSETEQEFNDPSLKSDVKTLFYLLVGYVAVHWPDVIVEVTDVFYQQGEFNSQSATHQEWRAIDVVLRGASETHTRSLEEWLNQNVMLSAPGMKPAVYHTIGHGLHLHLQTSKMGRPTIVRTNV